MILGKTSLYTSQMNTFVDLYNYMYTNVNANGTLPARAYSGLITYFNEYGVSYDYANHISETSTGGNPSISYISACIGLDCPVLLFVRNFENPSGNLVQHGVSAFGRGSLGTVVLSTGYDTEYHYYNYSSLTVYSLVYIGFN